MSSSLRAVQPSEFQKYTAKTCSPSWHLTRASAILPSFFFQAVNFGTINRCRRGKVICNSNENPSRNMHTYVFGFLCSSCIISNDFITLTLFVMHFGELITSEPVFHSNEHIMIAPCNL